MGHARAPRIYVETTVWNFVFADDAPERRRATERFFEQVRRGDFDVYISRAVLDEIEEAPKPRRTQLLGLIEEIRPTVMEGSEEADALAEEYIRNGVIPSRYDTDALHIAIAVVEEMDVLVSWNFKHIVKMKTRRMVGAMSRMAGYREIEIWTPEEVTDDD